MCIRDRVGSEPVALDAGALIALEAPRGRALLRQCEQRGRPVVISAGALAQVWRDPRRQVLLSRLVKQPRTNVSPLDDAAARACGALLAAAGSSDVIDAHVVLSAREHEESVIVT